LDFWLENCSRLYAIGCIQHVSIPETIVPVTINNGEITYHLTINNGEITYHYWRPVSNNRIICEGFSLSTAHQSKLYDYILKDSALKKLSLNRDFMSDWGMIVTNTDRRVKTILKRIISRAAITYARHKAIEDGIAIF
jgi:hypothetical protein